MYGGRASVFKNILFNPLVWIGAVLSFMTVSNAEDGDIWQIFVEPLTYRNLLIGSVIYVAFWGRKYTENRQRLDIGETIKTVFEVMSGILFFWVVFLLLFYTVHINGERYREELTYRYQQVQKNSENMYEEKGQNLPDEEENY